jgi:thiamine monophosphate kinase
VPRGMLLYARLCGETLARAHARSGDRVAIAAYLGRSSAFDEAIADFAESYADQNDADYAAFTGAIEGGRLEAVQGL